MARSLQKRFTIYDALDEAGVFETNPANVYAVDRARGVGIYARQEYPKMLYHPNGEMEIIKHGTMEMTRNNKEPILVNEQWGLISQIVNSAEEEAELLAAGWHDHPAKSIAASGKKAPPIVPAMLQSSYDAAEAKLKQERDRVKALEAEIAALRAKLDESDGPKVVKK